MNDEHTLLQRARTLDQTALVAIFDAYYSGIFRYIYFHTGHLETAEDLSAQVFVRLLEALRRGTGPDRYLKAWLFRVASNLIVDESRRGNHRNHLPLDDTFAALSASLDDTVQQSILVTQLHGALAELTDSQRSIIVLRFLLEMSIEETARIMQLSPGAVKAQQHRALAALRVQLEEESNREPIP